MSYQRVRLIWRAGCGWIVNGRGGIGRRSAVEKVVIHDLVMALADGPDIPSGGAASAGRDCAAVMVAGGQTDAADIVTDSGSAAGLIERISRDMCHNSFGDPDTMVIDANPSSLMFGPVLSYVVISPRPAWRQYEPFVWATIEYLRERGMLVTPVTDTAIGDTGDPVEVPVYGGPIQNPNPSNPADFHEVQSYDEVTKPTGEDWRMKRGLRNARDGRVAHPKAST